MGMVTYQSRRAIFRRTKPGIQAKRYKGILFGNRKTGQRDATSARIALTMNEQPGIMTPVQQDAQVAAKIAS
jgi:DNA invertase Pin-like site-specific DNA recombinase